MALTISGSAGQSGSLSLNDTTLSSSVTISLAGSLSTVTQPATIPANTSDSNWTLTGMYANSFYKGNLANLTTSKTSGGNITFNTIPNALCISGNCTYVNTLYVKDVGGGGVRIYWPSVLHSGAANDTANYTIVPPYGTLQITVPMQGLAVATSLLSLTSNANTTSAFVVLAYKDAAN